MAELTEIVVADLDASVVLRLGYHRLWAHRSYNASVPLQYVLAMWGTGAVQGSIKWWSRGHRAHHRYTDTELDPYNAHKGQSAPPCVLMPGLVQPCTRSAPAFTECVSFDLTWRPLWFAGFWYSHVGWMLLKPRRQMGTADVSDLSRSPVVKWQHKVSQAHAQVDRDATPLTYTTYMLSQWYLYLIIGMGFLFPTLVAGLGWGDWRGGFFFAGAARLTFVHHVSQLAP